MNDQLPPVDSNLSRQLARRASGAMPSTLVAETLSRLDAETGRRVGWSIRTPRAMAAGAAMALVAILAASLVVAPSIVGPAAHRTPRSNIDLTGYPTTRALTTAELVELMSGPPLKTGTTFVASVTIDVNRDVCPMNRAPTIGLLEGMGSQVCVMDMGGLTAEPAGKLSGVFVLQYWAPGVIASFGPVSPASAGALAYQSGETLPSTGRFLVDGWLDSGNVVGNDPAACPDSSPAADGSYGCRQYWLDDSKPNSFLRVEVQLDGPAPPLGHGVFALAASDCHGVSSCPLSFRLLIRLDDDPFAPTTEPTPSPTASPSMAPSPTLAALSTPHSGYPFDRVLTSAELAAFLADPSLKAGTTFVAQVTMKQNRCGAEVGQDDAVISSMPGRVCARYAGLTLPQVTDVFALRYVQPGVLQNLGAIVPATSTRLIHVGAAGWPAALTTDETFLVAGYLFRDGTTASITATPQSSIPSDYMSLVVDADAGVDSVAPSTYAVFAVELVWGGAPEPTPAESGLTADYISYHLRGVIDDLAIPGEASPSLTLTASPSPSPSPLVLPPWPATARGLWAEGDRPFTKAELTALWQADPAHLAGRIVIAKGPVYSSFVCPPASTAAATSLQAACQDPPRLADDGYWAIQIAADGKLSIIGALEVPAAGGFAFDSGLLTETQALRALGRVIVVDGWLSEVTYASCAHPETPPPNNCHDSQLSGTGPTDTSDLIDLQAGAYQTITGSEPDVAVSGPPVRGFFLVLVDSAQRGTILAQLSSVRP
jgi:hypothetical protein